MTPTGADDALLAGVLRRFLTDPGESNGSRWVELMDDQLAIDAGVDVTPEEHAAIERAIRREGVS